MSVCPLSVCLELKTSVNTDPIGLSSLGNIPTGPVMVLDYFLWASTSSLKKKKNTPLPLKFFLFLFETKLK